MLNHYVLQSYIVFVMQLYTANMLCYRITIVVDFEMFWVDERSPVVYDSRATQLPRTTLTTVSFKLSSTKSLFYFPFAHTLSSEFF